MSRYEKIELPKKPLTVEDFKKYAQGDGLTQTGTIGNQKIDNKFRFMKDGYIFAIFNGQIKTYYGEWKDTLGNEEAWYPSDENIQFLLNEFVNNYIVKKGVKTFGSILIEDLHGFQTSTPRHRVTSKKRNPLPSNKQCPVKVNFKGMI